MRITCKLRALRSSILFGATGDLAMRKLLPALYRRVAAGQIPPESTIIGVARSELSREEYLAAGARPAARRISARASSTPKQLGRLRASSSTTCASMPPSAEDFERLARAAARARRARARVLPVDGAEPVRAASATDLAARAGDAEVARRAGEAAGPGSRVGRGDQRARRLHLQRAADLPHRSLPRQGGRAEPAGAALRQHAVRAAVAARPHQPRADHGGRRRWASKRAASSTTRPARCATWCRTICCSSCASSRWSRRPAATRMRCATRS